MSSSGMDHQNPGPSKPVACSLYDVLESATVLRSPLLLVLTDRQINVFAKDVFAKGSEEFFKAADTETGEEHILRPDMIRQIIDPGTKKTYTSDQC